MSWYKIDIDRCTIVKREGRFVFVGAPSGSVGQDWPTRFEDKRSGECVFRSNEIMSGAIADTFGGYAKYEITGDERATGDGFPVDMTRFALGAGGWYRLGKATAITGEVYSVPADATTFRLGGSYTFR